MMARAIGVDEIFYFGEPAFQDGIIAQAVDEVKAMGVAYFSVAGNSARQSYEFAFVDSGQRVAFVDSDQRDVDYKLHAFDMEACL